MMDLATDRLTLRHGIIGGLIGGFAYFAAAIGLTIALGGVAAVETPLRQIAAVVLGPEGLTPQTSLPVVVILANVVHFALSAIYGVLLVAVARVLGLSGALALIVVGALYGLAIYAVNRLVIFPALFPWFLANDPLIQSVLHALFGAVIGWWLAGRGRP
jgi:uncharacterized membrane protein YagU involved in acid resistance